MSDWKSVLKENPTDWLLEKSNPSVRFFALIELFETLHFNGRKVDENILSILLSYKTITFLPTEPFDCSFWQLSFLLSKRFSKSPAPQVAFVEGDHSPLQSSLRPQANHFWEQ